MKNLINFIILDCRLIEIFVVLLFIQSSIFSQSVQCTTPMVIEPDLNTTYTSGFPQRCIKLNFHFLINSFETGEFPSDEYYANVLFQLNEIYLPGNIQFTFGSTCIDRVEIPPGDTILTASQLYSKVTTNAQLDPEPYLNFDTTSINVYTLLNTGGGRAEYGFNYVYSSLDPGTLAHELGHIFSLWHTHGPVEDGLLDTALWECKNGLNSLTAGDRMPDTGADPYGMDLDQVGGVDNGKWVDQFCRQSPLLTRLIADKCLDTITEWNIPIHNTMSYYSTCRNEFSNDQYTAMHNDIVNVKSDFLTDCGSDPYLANCSHIIIDTATVWTNDTFHMCGGQKIIIESSGSLTMNHCLITKRTIDTICPGLSGVWDGIYIEGGNARAIPPSPGGGPSFTARGNLEIGSSIVEHSLNGIQAPNGSGGILIDSSIMQNNFKLMNVKDKGQKDFSSFETVGGVTVRNGSLLSVPEECFDTQISIEGTSFRMDKSTLTKSTKDNSITGIKSMAGSVLIKNGSIIENMGRGINKETDGTYKQGLNGLRIQDSRFINCDRAIRNRCMYVNVKHNWIDGKVDQEMESYGFWHSNNFRKYLEIEAPTTTQQFEENYFFESTLNIPGDQSLTNAICNTWKDTYECVYDNNPSGSNIPIKPSWGAPATASGNKRADTVDAYHFVSYRTTQITNYRFVQNKYTHIECVNNQFKSGDAASDRGSCKDTLAPPTATGGDPIEEEEYDDDENHSTWTFYDSMWQVLVTALPYVSDSMKKIIQARIADLKVGMELCVLSAMQHSDSLEMDDESYDTWFSRTNPIAEELTEIHYYWHNLYLDTLLTYLGGLYPADSAEAIDKDILELATEYLDSLQLVGHDLYKLPDSTLEYLEDLASSSFEDYTGILRAFLNMYYNRYIDNDHMEEYSRKLPGNKATIEQKTNFIVYPNPTNDFFRVYSLDGRNYSLNLELYSLEGKKLRSMEKQTGESIYLSGLNNNSCIILQLENPKSGHKESMKLILNKE